MAAYLPVFLDLRGRAALVVGGGTVGEQKARAALGGGARVTVVSPQATRRLRALARARRLTWRARAFAPDDARGAALVVAATGRPGVDDAVAAAARAAGALVNVVDRADRCDVVFGAVLRRGDLQIAVSTGGRSPTLARAVRDRLEALFDAGWGEFLAEVGEARARARAGAAGRAARLEAGRAAALRALAARAARPGTG